MEKERIALYARVSSRKQAQEKTIESQLAALEEYASRHQYLVEVDLIFQDNGISGATLERPGLDALRDQALKGQIDKILILCPDRLARKHAHQLILVEEFHKLGVEIIFANREIGETPEDQLLLQIQGVISEYEREKIMERYRRGKLHQAKAGKVNVLSGAPYGFVYIKAAEGQEARYEIHPQEARVVQKIFELYTLGRKSIGGIAKQLTLEEIPTRSQKGFWERSTIWGMLKNPAYMGQAAYRKTHSVPREKLTKWARQTGHYPKHVHSSSRDRREEEWISIPVPAIITERIYRKAQEQLKENKKLSPRNNSKYEYLLSGLVHCQRCGYAIYGKPASNSRYKRCYYRCMGQDGHRWPNGRVCDAHPLRVEVLDEMVWNQLQQLIQSPDIVLNEYTQRTNSKKNQRLSLETMIEKKQKELRNQDLQKERLLDLYQNGTLSLKEIEARLASIRAKMTTIEQEKTFLEKDKERQLRQLQVIEQFEVFKEKMNMNLTDLTFDQKKTLVRLLISEVSVDTKSEEILIRHTLPLENSNPSKPPGSSGNSNHIPESSEHLDICLDTPTDIVNSQAFEENLKKSFPLCTGSNFPYPSKRIPQ
jgi:site-specific DNA recombinase